MLSRREIRVADESAGRRRGVERVSTARGLPAMGRLVALQAPDLAPGVADLEGQGPREQDVELEAEDVVPT